MTTVYVGLPITRINNYSVSIDDCRRKFRELEIDIIGFAGYNPYGYLSWILDCNEEQLIMLVLSGAKIYTP